ncbi:hypothetical protein MK079_00015 [Candidatus Gracilibacteria bacterium]|nr:hypothetical protein [Candidatus Gracilibacteria bacterium]
MSQLQNIAGLGNSENTVFQSSEQIRISIKEKTLRIQELTDSIDTKKTEDVCEEVKKIYKEICAQLKSSIKQLPYEDLKDIQKNTVQPVEKNVGNFIDALEQSITNMIPMRASLKSTHENFQSSSKELQKQLHQGHVLKVCRYIIESFVGNGKHYSMALVDISSYSGELGLYIREYATQGNDFGTIIPCLYQNNTILIVSPMVESKMMWCVGDIFDGFIDSLVKKNINPPGKNSFAAGVSKLGRLDTQELQGYHTTFQEASKDMEKQAVHDMVEYMTHQVSEALERAQNDTENNVVVYEIG